MSTMLYVDDEESIGVAISRWFTRRGHTVLLAPTLRDAQQMLVANEPDVLFIDVWLGRDSGFELMSWLEDTRPHLAARVVFVTGELADADSATRVWRTLGRPVLQKPFTFDELARYLDAAEREAREARNRVHGTGAEERRST